MGRRKGIQGGEGEQPKVRLKKRGRKGLHLAGN